MNDNTPFWGRFSSLWLLLAPMCAVAYTLTTTISPNDFWWHAAAGRLMVERGQLQQTNHFAWAVATDKPYVYQNWLAEWSIFQVLRFAGISGIALWRSAAVGLTFLILGATAMRRARSLGLTATATGELAAARSIAIALFLALAMIALNLDARPQTFVIPFFALFTFAIFELPHILSDHRRAAGVMAALMVLTTIWANCHGSFFLAAPVFFIVSAAEAFYSFISSKRTARPFGTPFTPRQLGWVMVMTLGCGIAETINPLGFGIFGYVAKLSNDTTVQKYMYEWQAPSPTDGTNLVFFVSIAFALLVARMAARRQSQEAGPRVESLDRPAAGLRLSEITLTLVLFVLGCRNIRSILWYALFFAPVFATVLSMAFAPARTETVSASRSRGAKLANGVALLLPALLMVPLLPSFKGGLGWPRAFRSRFAPTPKGSFPEGFGNDAPMLLDKNTPVTAAEYLRAHPPRGRLWNDMACGSYLMWATPGIKVAADPRIELYPASYWLSYLGIARGGRSAPSELERQGVSDVLLDPEAQAGLLATLRKSPFWSEVKLRASYPILLHRI